MKNKILLLSIILCALFAIPATAQQKPLDFSIKVYGGYGVYQTASNLYPVYYFHFSNGMATYYDYKTIDMKLGQSPHFGIGGSLKLSDRFSAGLDLDYLTGSRDQKYALSTTIGSQAISYHLFSFIPNISYGIVVKPKYTFYNTFGIVVGAATKLNVKYAEKNESVSTDSTSYSQVYKFGVNVGLKEAVGVKFGLAKNLKAFAEVNGFFMAANPTSRTITTQGSTDYQVFKNSGSVGRHDTKIGSTTDSYYTQSPENPYSFSSIGVNVGFIFSLGK